MHKDYFNVNRNDTTLWYTGRVIIASEDALLVNIAINRSSDYGHDKCPSEHNCQWLEQGQFAVIVSTTYSYPIQLFLHYIPRGPSWWETMLLYMQGSPIRSSSSITPSRKSFCTSLSRVIARFAQSVALSDVRYIFHKKTKISVALTMVSQNCICPLWEWWERRWQP